MRDNDGRKLDHKTLEVLRVRAVEQVEAGAHPEDVAEALGLHRKTVYGWLAKYREGGKDALKAKPVPGRPSKLDGRQIARLYALIAGRDLVHAGGRIAVRAVHEHVRAGSWAPGPASPPSSPFGRAAYLNDER